MADLRQLAKTILKDPNANHRKAALLEIRQHDDPRIVELLEHVSLKDRDRAVRDLAGNLLTKKKTNTLLGLSSSSGADAWFCEYCEAENAGGDTCQSCGAARPGAPARQAPVPENDEALFLVNPANRALLSGKSKRLTGSLGIGCGLLFMIPFLLAGILVIVMAFNEMSDYNELRAYGVITQGEYVSRRISTDDDGDDTYYVSFQYTYNDQSYTNEQRASWSTYDRFEKGARVNIEYVPHNPGISKIEGTNTASDFQFLLIFAGIWNVIVWPFTLIMVINWRGNRILVREGQFVRGELLAINGSLDSDDDFNVKVQYSFVAPDSGELLFKTENQTSNALKDKPLPPKGSPIMVLYRSAQHFKIL